MHFSKKLQVVQGPKCSIILFSKLATSEVYFLCHLPGEVSSLCGLNQGLFRAFLVSKN